MESMQNFESRILEITGRPMALVPGVRGFENLDWPHGQIIMARRNGTFLLGLTSGCEEGDEPPEGGYVLVFPARTFVLVGTAFGSEESMPALLPVKEGQDVAEVLAKHLFGPDVPEEYRGLGFEELMRETGTFAKVQVWV